MRKNQRWLMLMVSIIVIVAFVFLYNKTDLDKLGQSSVGTIYGRAVTGSEFARSEKQFDIARLLGMYDLLQVLASGDDANQTENYVWNTLILRKNAENLRIVPSSEAVAEKIQQLPVFQTESQFDFEKYQAFVANGLTPRGFSEEQLNELVRDDLRLARLRDLVGSSAVVTEGEVMDAYGMAFRKRHLLLVKMKRDAFEKDSIVTPAEIKEHFEKNKATYQNEEKRSAKFVSFVLSDADKKLAGKERVAALQPISEKADAFSQRLLKPGANFEAIAKELVVPVQETATFTTAAPPAEIASLPNVGSSVFALTAEMPDSEVLQTPDGFYIFHLAKTEPATPQTLEQATPKITSTLKEEKVAAALTAKSDELHKTLQAAVKSGQTFTQAAQAAGLTVETIPPYAPAELQQSQDFSADRLVQMRAATLAEGAISDLIPTMDGGAIAFLEKLEPLDEAKWKTDRESILDRYSSSRVEMTFGEWFRAQRAAAQVRRGPSAG